MEYRSFGRSGLQVSAIGYGCMTFGESGGMDQTAVEEMVGALHGAGVNFFDHSEAYGSEHARGPRSPESMFGRAVRKLGIKRSDLVVSSKIFNHYNNAGLGVNEIGLSRKHLREGMEGILERLGPGFDYVDVISAHRPDEVTPIEETVRGFNYLIDSGQALYWGTSNWTAAQLTEANLVAQRLGMVGPIAEQPPYSMLSRQLVEGEFAPIYDKYGLGIMCYSPLAGGVLTGKYAQGGEATARSRFNQRGGAAEADVAKTEELRPIADELGCSLAHLALGWALANKNISTLITGATSIDQAMENLKCLKVLPKLTPAVMAKIELLLADRAPTLPTNFRARV